MIVLRPSTLHLITRRSVLAALAFGVLALPRASEAQRAAKVYRIGVLGTVGPWTTFVRGLQELGWIEGQNVLIEYRFTRGDMSLYPVFAAEPPWVMMPCTRASSLSCWRIKPTALKVRSGVVTLIR